VLARDVALKADAPTSSLSATRIHKPQIPITDAKIIELRAWAVFSDKRPV